MNEFVIIVAGGSGSRMNSDIPKQFMPIAGKPVLMHTLEAFRAYNSQISIRLVLPESQFETWLSLCDQHGGSAGETLVPGGMTRFHSVHNGLKSILEEEGIVAVHDGVRPFISAAIIANSFSTAAHFGSAVTCVKLKDSVRSWQSETQHKALDREHFRLIQTPQTFRLDWMRNAFGAGYLPHFTDCASVLEKAGYPIHLIDGAYQNIKITTPDDLLWAEVLVNQRP